MKILFTTFTLLLFVQSAVFAQTEFTLDPTQSMLMTGKGPGQDATINPFEGEDCYAIIQNIGGQTFSVRIQKNSVIIDQIPVSKGEVKKIKLLSGQELYLDPNSRGTSNARVDYERMKPE